MEFERRVEPGQGISFDRTASTLVIDIPNKAEPRALADALEWAQMAPGLQAYSKILISQDFEAARAVRVLPRRTALETRDGLPELGAESPVANTPARIAPPIVVSGREMTGTEPSGMKPSEAIAAFDDTPAVWRKAVEDRLKELETVKIRRIDRIVAYAAMTVSAICLIITARSTIGVSSAGLSITSIPTGVQAVVERAPPVPTRPQQVPEETRRGEPSDGSDYYSKLETSLQTIATLVETSGGQTGKDARRRLQKPFTEFLDAPQQSSDQRVMAMATRIRMSLTDEGWRANAGNRLGPDNR
jgi:hypothetical protein